MNQTPFQISLDAFEGPLDLMLHLIHEQKLDLFDLDMSRLADQYIKFVQSQENLDDASEYMVEFARLLEYKSRKLLPRTAEQETFEEEIKNDYSERLLEYLQYKEAARTIREFADLFSHHLARKPDSRIQEWEKTIRLNLHPVALESLSEAYNEMLRKIRPKKSEPVSFHELDVRQRINELTERFEQKPRLSLQEVFQECISRLTLVITFLAVLEMIHEGVLELEGEELQYGSG